MKDTILAARDMLRKALEEAEVNPIVAQNVRWSMNYLASALEVLKKMEET